MSYPEAVHDSMDQASLDREYSPSSCVSGSIDRYLNEYAARSREVRSRLAGLVIERYGTHADETLNLFRPTEGRAPLFVFFHGGYWQMLGKDDFDYCAPAFLARNIAFASVNYSLMPGTDIDTIVEQSGRAVSWLSQNAASLGLDAERIFVGGHSAGAQLAAMCLNSVVSEEGGHAVRGASLISGLFDLEPLRHTSENRAFRFTPESVARNSPARHLPHRGQSVFACFGEYETREFKRQTRGYVQACAAAGCDTRWTEVKGCNHFDVVSELADASSSVFQAVAAQIATARGAGSAEAN